MENEPLSFAEVEEDKHIPQEDLEGKQQPFGRGIEFPFSLSQIDASRKGVIRDSQTPLGEYHGATL